jgi:hypothetical protein
MSQPRVLECARCGAPVRYQVPFCAYCHAPLTWGGMIPLGRGALLHRGDYPEAPLLGGTLLPANNLVRTEQGHGVHVAPEGAFWAVSKLKARDMCVAVTAMTTDVQAGFGAVARAHTSSGIMDAYVALVVPGCRSFRLSRVVEGGKVGASRYLHDWECSPVIAPPGQPNTIELRAADTMLQVLVNGVRLASLVDAGLGFGAFGWRAVSLGARTTVVLRSLEAYGVVAEAAA